MNEILAEKIKALPSSPGVYLMKDNHGKIIYVGKAVSLKNRVRQYFFDKKPHADHIEVMIQRIADFETILTQTEVDALILECNLIKRHRPPYNILLKDDKTYPYLKLTLAEDFPRLLLTRRIIKDGSKYFGPYTRSLDLQTTRALLQKLFPLRTCKTMPKDRACLEFHIGRCFAPCENKISKKDYAEIVQNVSLFLDGHTKNLEQQLLKKMNDCANQLKFEQASFFRDKLKSLQQITNRQAVFNLNANTENLGDTDIFGVCETCVYVLLVRDGKLLGQEHFFFTQSLQDESLFLEALKQYYIRTTFIPKKIFLPCKLSSENQKLLQEWLRVKLFFPKQGTRFKLVTMANDNAKKIFHDEQKQIENFQKALEELQNKLHLAQKPKRMECFDISHNQGQETVASMVVFENGKPNKNFYRHFKIRSSEGKPDDFLSMREVIFRRYIKSNEKIFADEKNFENEKNFADFPDLIVIDGGKGQLNAALEILQPILEKNKNLQVIGLAKRLEEIFLPHESESILLEKNSPALHILQHIRDEAHRFAITYHRSLRRKRNLHSFLDDIEGIGQKRKTALRNYFGLDYLKKMQEASVDELSQIPTMNKLIAQRIYDYFHE